MFLTRRGFQNIVQLRRFNESYQENHLEIFTAHSFNYRRFRERQIGFWREYEAFRLY